MQFAGSAPSRRVRRAAAVEATTLLSMYKGASRHEVTIGDFEVWSLNRLRGTHAGPNRACLLVVALAAVLSSSCAGPFCG